ncbi:type II secretion system protein [Halalkalibacter nanhaiisediminis]
MCKYKLTCFRKLHNRGITLIEVIAVLTILGILETRFWVVMK